MANLGAQLIPLGVIADNVSRIARDKKVVVHCRSGARSATAIRELESKFGFENLYNLKGGILAYQAEIQSEV
jgi:adenylyltransferase/sulfurtransferase